jgi:branched-chain amino acid transport system ATP-binding protein
MAETFAIEGVGLTRRFGGFTALDAVKIAVPDGEIRGLIGPNGAGKSTLIDVLSGRADDWEGTVRLGGEDISALTVQERRRGGLARSFQRTNIFPSSRCANSSRLRRGAPRRRTDEVLQEMGLAGIAHMRAADVSYGDTAGSISRSPIGRPTVLLLDEPLPVSR